MVCSASAVHHDAELIDDGAFGGLAPEDEPGDAHHDQQDRGNGEQRIIGDRRAPAQRIVGDEGFDHVAQQQPQAPQAVHDTLIAGPNSRGRGSPGHDRALGRQGNSTPVHP